MENKIDEVVLNKRVDNEVVEGRLLIDKKALQIRRGQVDMKLKKISISPKYILLAILVAISIYAWRPNFLGDISLYKILFPLCFIGMIITKKVNKRNIGNNLRRTSYCWLAISLWGIISLLWINYTGNEWSVISYDINWILIGVCFSIFCLHECYRERLLKYFCILAELISVIGIITAFTGFYFNETYESYYYVRNFLNLYRPNTIFYNVNDNAVFMFFSIIILFISTEKENRGTFKRIIGLVLFGLNIILVDSRGVELGVMIFFSMYLFAIRKIKIFYKILIIIAILLFSFFNLDTILSLGIFSSGLEDSGRIEIVAMCLSSLACTNYWGVGPGNIAFVNDSLFSSSIVAPHNFFVEILCDYGIVGFISVVIWFVGNLTCAYKMAKYDERGMIVWIALISFLPVSIVSSSLIGKSWVACFFGILVAILNAIEYDVKQSVDS